MGDAICLIHGAHPQMNVVVGLALGLRRFGPQYLQILLISAVYTILSLSGVLMIFADTACSSPQSCADIAGLTVIMEVGYFKSLGEWGDEESRVLLC